MNKFPDKEMYYIYFNTCFWDQLTPTELEDMLMDLDRRFKEMEEQGRITNAENNPACDKISKKGETRS